MFQMTRQVNLVLNIALLVKCVYSQASVASVTIKNSLITGQVTTAQVGDRQVEVEVYLGLPYAQPPIGDERFIDPQPFCYRHDINATVPPKACLQKVTEHLTAEDMSEDCLYFNIWRPRCNKTQMTTLVWIHGGSLKTGSSRNPQFNGTILAARECVIVASMNYRLGVMGFLYAGVPESMGNYGLQDVRLALTVIKTNLATFGGDNNKITIMGGGAGAFIASIFLVSPKTRSLFTRAILQSGSPLMKMLYQSTSSALQATKELSNSVQCQSSSMEVLLNCMRQASGVQLVNAYEKLFRGMRYRMVAVTDNIILHKSPSEYILTNDVKRCNILVGTNRDEGTETLIKIMPGDFNVSVHEPPVISDEKLDSKLLFYLGMIYKQPFVTNVTSMLKQIYDYSNVSRDNTTARLLLSSVTRDLAYNCPLNRLIDTYIKQNQSVFLYSFEHAPDNTELPSWVGATHGTEIHYLFRTLNPQLTAFSEREITLSEKMQKLWADFAKTGNPTPSSSTVPQWTAYTHTDEKLLVFTENAKLNVIRAETKYCRYWNDLPPEMIR